MKKIYLGGCPFGSENIGEDAILSALIDSFSNNNSELTIFKIRNMGNYISEYVEKKNQNTVMYENNIYAKPILGISLCGRRNPIKSIFNHQLNKKKLLGKDLFVCGGGTLITDLPWHTIKVLEISQKLHVPTILFGVGMAEIKDKSSVKPLKNILNQINDIYVRDEFVKRKLIKIGIEQERINICYDPAVMLKPNSNLDLNRYLSKHEIDIYNNGRLNIGMSLSSDIDIRHETNFEEIQHIITFIKKKYRANIFLIPTYFYKNSDALFMENLATKTNVVLLRNRFVPEDMIHFLKGFNLILSSRLHLNILASIVGTPFIGIIRNSKVSDFSNIHSLNSFYFSEIKNREILGYIDLILKQEVLFRQQIIAKNAEMQLIHSNCVQSIFTKYLS
jgi:polysaccharide pyruvyl transferase WcaK-like protein